MAIFSHAMSQLHQGEHVLLRVDTLSTHTVDAYFESNLWVSVPKTVYTCNVYRISQVIVVRK